MLSGRGGGERGEQRHCYWILTLRLESKGPLICRSSPSGRLRSTLPDIVKLARGRLYRHHDRMSTPAASRLETWTHCCGTSDLQRDLTERVLFPFKEIHGLTGTATHQAHHAFQPKPTRGRTDRSSSSPTPCLHIHFKNSHFLPLSTKRRRTPGIRTTQSSPHRAIEAEVSYHPHQILPLLRL